MSICISREGEYSEHTLGPDYECETCGAVDVSAALAELRRTQFALRDVLDVCDRVEASIIPRGDFETGQKSASLTVRAAISAALGEEA